MHMDDVGTQQLWEQVDAFFARLSEAVGSLSYDPATRTLTWLAVDNSVLSSLSLSTLAKTTEAAHSLSADRQSKALVLKDVTGNQTLSTVSLADILSDATGSVNYAWSLGISGKRLYLKDKDGNEIQGSGVTLP